MKIGAWIHPDNSLPLADLIASAAENGLSTLRCYHYGYAQQAAPAIKQAGMSLFAGMNVDAAGLVADWRSQLRLDDLARYHDLKVPLEAICVGNELREGGDRPELKRFSACLSFGLANLLEAYRNWLDQHGYPTLLTYAMEGIVFDAQGYFNEWLWPLIDACDVVSVNLYPMADAAWFGFGAFEQSRRFLCDPRTRHDRLNVFEYHLRLLLDQLERAGKPLILSETGFPSAVSYRNEGEHRIVPESDNPEYASAMEEFVALIVRVNEEHYRAIRGLYFYEWWDNLYHTKIWNEENSPIHSAFGLCDAGGKPKLDISRLVDLAR